MKTVIAYDRIRDRKSIMHLPMSVQAILERDARDAPSLKGLNIVITKTGDGVEIRYQVDYARPKPNRFAKYLGVWSLKGNVKWFRTRSYGPGLALHLPSSKPLFSERHGYHKPIFKLLGWRLFLLKPVKK